ncbi:MAG: hypothetical protein ACPHGY_09140 [Rhodospirillaceae bacterium]
MADIYTLIDRDDESFRVILFSPPAGRRRAVRIIMLPGANCDAKRYRWLNAPLAAEGALKPEAQKSDTIKLIAAFLSTIADERPDTIANALNKVSAEGDQVTVR